MKENNKLIIAKAGKAYSYLGVTFLTMCVLFFLGHCFLGILYHFRNSSPDDRKENPALNSLKSKNDFFDEFKGLPKVKFHPYLHWLSKEKKGKHVNIDKSSIRKTTDTPNDNSKKIFVFGGSTIWGTAVPDEDTVPSYLQRLLGDSYKIYNFGESGYVSTQEVIRLILELQKNNIPDIVIFYDGVNDSYAGIYSPGIPGEPQNARSHHQRSESGFLLSLIFKSNYKLILDYIAISKKYQKSQSLTEWEESISKNQQENAKKILDIYLSNTKIVNGLAKEYQFQAYFFWQPILYTKDKKLSLSEQLILDHTSDFLIKSINLVYDLAAKTLSNLESNNIYNLSTIFSDNDKPMYFDWCHLGPDGNKIIADAIYQRIKK